MAISHQRRKKIELYILILKKQSIPYLGSCLGSILMSVAQLSPKATCMPWGSRPSVDIWESMGRIIVRIMFIWVASIVSQGHRQCQPGHDWCWRLYLGLWPLTARVWLITVAPDTIKGLVNTWGLDHFLKSGGDLRVMLSHATAEAIQNWVTCAINWDHAALWARATAQGQVWSMALPQ